MTIVEQLKSLARDFESLAMVATTHDDEIQNRTDAAQTRLLANITARADDPTAHAWLAAGRKVIAAREKSAMNAVHESRSSRRAARPVNATSANVSR